MSLDDCLEGRICHISGEHCSPALGRIAYGQQIILEYYYNRKQESLANAR